LKVLFVSAEAVPFAKVGGMADVVGSLPAALRRLEVDARVIVPGYGFINHDKYNITHLFSFQLALHEDTADVHVYTTVYSGVPYYFIQSWPYFGDDSSVYTEWEWDVPRFITFNQLVMGAIFEMSERLDWFPEIVHINDWHTGLLPFLIAGNRHLARWENIKTVLSIHNLAYQGDHVGGWLWQAGIPGRHHRELVYLDLTDNMLAIAIAYSDIITTVSPRYAIEIQYPYLGCGLDGLIRARVADLYGILNGIDTDLWNPATDPVLAANYGVTNFTVQRGINKRHLLELAGFDVQDDVMVIGLVSRLVWQKGIDIVLPALRTFLLSADVRFIGLGTGEHDLERDLYRLGRDFHWRTRCFLQYDNTIAQHIYGGCDLFLMPSHFEPCGMGQMIAMRYGALPLVRDTGGLADTVINYDDQDGERGTGFVFQWEEPEAVVGTLRWAWNTYVKRPRAWQQMQKNAMMSDFSWDASAQRYYDLYDKLAN
jgi:starch synthase